MESEYKKITGHKTPEERKAWDDGYDAATKVIIKYIENWKGQTTSKMGDILSKKMKELYEQEQ